MQRFKKEELQEQAAKFMKAYKVEDFHATEDGNFFQPSDYSLAVDHNAKHVKGEVFTFKAKAEKPVAKPKDADPAADSAAVNDPALAHLDPENRGEAPAVPDADKETKAPKTPDPAPEADKEPVAPEADPEPEKAKEPEAPAKAAPAKAAKPKAAKAAKPKAAKEPAKK